MKKALLEVLEKTELMRDDNTKEIMNGIVEEAFFDTNEKNCGRIEELAAVAYKYNLPCLDIIVREMEYNSLPF